MIVAGGATEATVWSNVFPIEEVAPGWTKHPTAGRSRTRAITCSTRSSRPCPVGVAGRSLHRRRLPGRRLRPGAGADGAEVPPRSMERGGAGRAPLPHRRPRPLPAGWQSGVPGAARPPGQDPRLPRRAGEIEAALAAPSGRGAVVGALDRPVPKGEAPGWSPTWPAGTAPRSARRACGEPLRETAAGLHGARRLRDARRAAPHPQRQGGPQGPAGAGDARRARSDARRRRRHAGTEEVLAGPLGRGAGARAGRALDDHFFALGGHSLLATQVRVAAARGVRGRGAAARPLRGPALADLAARVEAALRGRGGAGRGAAGAPALRRPREGPLPSVVRPAAPLVPRSARAGEPALQHPGGAARRRAARRRACWRSRLGEIVRRHEALRTVFAVREGAPVQVIQPAAPFRAARGGPVGPAGEPARAAGPRAGRRGGRPPVRSRARPAAARRAAAAGAPGDGRPCRRADHAPHRERRLVAWASWCARWGRSTRRSGAGRPSPLPELPVQYADFAVWQRSWLRGEVLEDELSFWRRQLADLPLLLELPTDRPRPAVQSFRGATRPMRLPAGLTRQVETLGAGAPERRSSWRCWPGSRPSWRGSAGRPDLARGLAGRRPQPGRDRGTDRVLRQHPGAARRLDTGGRHVPPSCWARAREMTLARLPAPGPAVRAAGPGAGAGAEPRPRAPVPGDARAAERADGRAGAAGPAAHAGAGRPGAARSSTWTFTWSADETGLAGASDLCRRPVRRPGRWSGSPGIWSACWRGPWRIRTARSPSCRCSPRRNGTSSWSSGAAVRLPAPLLVPKSIPELFAAQARAHPRRGRGVFLGKRADLPGAGRAGGLPGAYPARVGSRSRDRGGGLRRPLGRSAGRSPGGARAGGAYVPLDPSTPRERLAFLLEDCGAAVVLTQKYLEARLPPTQARVLLLDEVPAMAAELPGQPIDPDQAAYAIYTSIDRPSQGSRRHPPLPGELRPSNT